MNKWLKPIIAVGVLIALILVARAYNLDDKLGIFKEWVAEQGTLGPIVFIAVYAVATVLAIPGSALTIIAGAIFGSIVGVLCVITGATIGACLCFIISRYFLRSWVYSLLEKNEKFKKLDDLTEKNGAIIVAITRLVPIFPFNLLNYGFGLTKVPFVTYALWSALCMLPGSILYVVGTDAIAKTLEHGEIPYSLIGIVLLIVLLLTVAVKQAKGKLKE